MCCFFNSCRRRRNCCDSSTWERCCNRWANRNSFAFNGLGCGQSSFNNTFSASRNQEGCCCQQTARCCQ